MANTPPVSKPRTPKPQPQVAGPAVEADLEGEGDFEAPRNRAPARPRMGMQNRSSPIANGEAVREVQDKLRSDPDRRRLLAKRKRSGRNMQNPFFHMEQASGLPKLPQDDPEWSYKWIRHQAEGKSDAKNLQASTAGDLRYEFVRMADLPPEYQTALSMFSQLEGRFEGCIVFNDLVVGRTSREMRDWKMDYMDTLASEQIAATRQEFMDAGTGEFFTSTELDDERIVERMD
jgi:hypothetical protein